MSKFRLIDALLKRAIATGAVLLGGLALAPEARASTILFTSFDTVFASPHFGSIPALGLAAGASVPNFSWNYSGNYADPRLAAKVSSPTSQEFICLGPAGACGSNNNDGVAGNEYAGYEFYYFTFSLPTDATNIKLIFDFLNADDRPVLGVNGTQIGGFSSRVTVPAGVTITDMKDGAGNHTVLFKPYINAASTLVIDTQSLFHAGENFFSLWVNNTDSTDIAAAARAHDSSGDPSGIVVAGGISFDVVAAVPEPATVALLGLALAGLGFIRRRRAAGNQIPFDEQQRRPRGTAACWMPFERDPAALRCRHLF